MTKLARGIVRFRWAITAGFIGLAAVSALQIRRARIDSNMKSMLPPDMQSRLNTDAIDEIFGGTDMLMVILQTGDVLSTPTLQRVKSLSRKLKRIEGVDKVLSLFELKNIRSDAGSMIVEPAVPRIPEDEADRERLRQEIRNNDLVFGSVVATDFTLTAVIALLKTDVSDDVIVPAVYDLVDEEPGPETVFFGGLPYTRYQVSASIRQDLRRLLPLGLVFMLIFLFLCFRQMRGVVLPFLVVVLSIAFSLGLIPLLGWKFQVITILLPVMLIAIANDYGIHLIAKYQEYNTPENRFTSQELAQKIFVSLSRPVLLTGLTTIAGMLCLLGHIIIPARQLSVLAALGILFALVASLFFIPAVISLLPQPKPLSQVPGKGTRRRLLERLLAFFGRVVPAYPRTVIAVASVLALAFSAGILSVEIDTDPNHYYPEDHPVAQAADLINRSLGGAQNVSLVFQGDIKDPRLMNKIDITERQLTGVPDVGNTTSVARVMRQMSRALHSPEERNYDRIPDTRNAVAQYFELYAMSGDPEDFEKLVDFPYEHALLTARLQTSSTKKLDRFLERIRIMVADDPDVRLVGGFGTILAEIARSVVRGQFLSLTLALLVVGFLLMLLFRSMAAGVIAAVPLALSVTVLFGLMGVFGIELNVTTAMLSSIMIGVGVDYTIHFLWRYREERRRGLAPDTAVHKTLTTTGRGIVFNAFSVVIGFAVLMTSGFLPVQFFGFLVVVSIVSCLTGALVLIPALVLVVRPRFLEPFVGTGRNRS
jgi:hydrophobe/amphiphile efflux-3 (HAE3) family protein